MADAPGIAVVGMSFREGPTAVRSLMHAIDELDDGPSGSLLKQGTVTGIVRVHTCSRAEWILSAPQPLWAAELLRASLLSRVGKEAEGRQMHLKAGFAAVHYLVRVSLGLESLAEGEQAVGRQMLKSFDAANKAGLTDKMSRQIWRGVMRCLQLRRDTLPPRDTHGVQGLVIRRMQLAAVEHEQKVIVLGMGEMGRATARALERHGYKNVETHGRSSLDAAMKSARDTAVVVITAGGPEAWVELPERDANALVIDVGSPAQLKSAPGWTVAGLDQLLEGEGAQLPDDERAQLWEVAETATFAMLKELKIAPKGKVLGAIDEESRAFLRNELPSLMANLSPEEAKKLKSGLNQFTHRLLKRTRSEDVT